MARVAPFYSVNEVKKFLAARRHHNNDACPSGRDIPPSERRSGTLEYKLCEHCDRLG
jgi:hypothetical protein